MTKRSGAPGLRLQILVALAGVILLAYVPLFFAIAQVTRASSLAEQDSIARSLGRAVAAHVADIASADRGDIERTIRTQLGDAAVLAIGMYGPQGEAIAIGGTGLGAPPHRPYSAGSARATSASGRAIDIVFPVAPDGAVVVRVRAEEDRARTGRLVRGIALYMGVFALALLVAAYIALTRAIVRPIEDLARATDRVASGEREITVTHAGAREIAELGASIRDMTGRLLREEQALRDKVAELTSTTRRLSKTREQLADSERLASVGKLAAGVAHEIGNPIAAIMGLYDLILDPETTEEVRADFLVRMRKETERIHVVVRDLLDFARPEEQAPESERGGGALIAEVALDVTRLVRPQKDFKGIEIRLEVAHDLSVALSPQRLTQVLFNLVLNAGAALATKVMSGNATIVVRARRDGSKALIEVEDDGPGVPTALRAKIFDPFVTTKEVGSGTGLGLAVCRGIVEGAKGRIYLDEQTPIGARFVVELPLSAGS